MSNIILSFIILVAVGFISIILRLENIEETLRELKTGKIKNRCEDENKHGINKEG